MNKNMKYQIICGEQEKVGRKPLKLWLEDKGDNAITLKCKANDGTIWNVLMLQNDGTLYRVCSIDKSTGLSLDSEGRIKEDNGY